MSPIFAPLRSSTAFVATVVPCTKRAMLSGEMPHSRAMCSTARSTPALGFARVVGIFTSFMSPFAPRHTTSVNVPPISTPTS